MSTEPRSVVQIWKEFGSLINTGVIVTVALGSIFTLGVTYSANNNAIADNRDAIARLEAKQDRKWEDHAIYHKDRAETAARDQTSTNERLKSLEAQQSQYDRLSDRVAVTDSNLNSLASSVRDLVSKFNDYAGDLKVMKEILQRMEQSQKGK